MRLYVCLAVLVTATRCSAEVDCYWWNSTPQGCASFVEEKCEGPVTESQEEIVSGQFATVHKCARDTYKETAAASNPTWMDALFSWPQQWEINAGLVHTWRWDGNAPTAYICYNSGNCLAKVPQWRLDELYMLGQTATLSDYECLRDVQYTDTKLALNYDMTPAIPPNTPPGNCVPDYAFYGVYPPGGGGNDPY